MLPLLKPVLHSRRSDCNERPADGNEEWPPLAATGESPCAATKTQHSQKSNNNLKKLEKKIKKKLGSHFQDEPKITKF